MPTFDVLVAEKLLTKLINIDKIGPAVISLYRQKKKNWDKLIDHTLTQERPGKSVQLSFKFSKKIGFV